MTLIDRLVSTDSFCIDANVVIQAANVEGSAAAEVLAQANRRGIRCAVSRHSIEEIKVGSEKDEGRAEALAVRLVPIAYYPKGSISELLGTIAELAGTLADMDRSHKLLAQLAVLANAGADLHDKGALIDAIWAGCTYFVTEDRDLVGTIPRARIQAALAIRIATPAELLSSADH